MKTPKYGKAGSAIFTIDFNDGKLVTPTCISLYNFIEGGRCIVDYRFNVPKFTIENTDFMPIKKFEFYSKLREIEKNIGGKIYIKNNWV